MIPSNAKKVFQGKIFSVWQWEQQMYDGTKATFENVKRANAADVVAIVKDKIILLRQEQPGQKKYVSLPGGGCDIDEDMLSAAKRELLEETGYISNEWELWLDFQPQRKIDYHIGTFIAKNCTFQEKPQLDPGEKIELTLVGFEEFLSLNNSPQFHSINIALELLRITIDEAKKTAFKKRLFGEELF